MSSRGRGQDSNAPDAAQQEAAERDPFRWAMPAMKVVAWMAVLGFVFTVLAASVLVSPPVWIVVAVTDEYVVVVKDDISPPKATAATNQFPQLRVGDKVHLDGEESRYAVDDIIESPEPK